MKAVVLMGVLLIGVIAIVSLHGELTGQLLAQKEIIHPVMPPIKPFKPVLPPITPVTPFQPVLPPIQTCVSGESHCNGNVVISCLNGEWEAVATCMPPQKCINAQCVSKEECSGSSRRCVGTNLQVCINGQWEVAATCAVCGQYCTRSGCVDKPAQCASGQTLCNGNTFEQCVNGQWQASENCNQYEYCTSQGCMPAPPIPPNIFVVSSGQLSCPTVPLATPIQYPDALTSKTDCDLDEKTVTQYLDSIEKILTTCSSIQTQQQSIANSDKNYIDYQISTFGLPLYQGTVSCSLASPIAPLAPLSDTDLAKDKTYFVNWLKRIDTKIKAYCEQVQHIVDPLVNACANINTNLPSCGTDYTAQLTYHTYLANYFNTSNQLFTNANTAYADLTLTLKQFRATFAPRCA